MTHKATAAVSHQVVTCVLNRIPNVGLLLKRNDNARKERRITVREIGRRDKRTPSLWFVINNHLTEHTKSGVFWANQVDRGGSDRMVGARERARDAHTSSLRMADASAKLNFRVNGSNGECPPKDTSGGRGEEEIPKGNAPFHLRGVERHALEKIIQAKLGFTRLEDGAGGGGSTTRGTRPIVSFLCHDGKDGDVYVKLCNVM